MNKMGKIKKTYRLNSDFSFGIVSKKGYYDLEMLIKKEKTGIEIPVNFNWNYADRRTFMFLVPGDIVHFIVEFDPITYEYLAYNLLPDKWL